MARALPLSNDLRESLAQELDGIIDPRDPLIVFGREVFQRQHWSRMPKDTRNGSVAFYLGIIRYCELSAWSEDPPLIVALLQAFQTFALGGDLIERILDEGPFRCHPPGYPPFVARVAAEAPLLDRGQARAAALGFDPRPPVVVPAKRVLLVKGESTPGLPSTLLFFRYLAAIQPEKTGVLYIDFGSQELLTQAASANIPVELLIARDLEQQVRRVREDQTDPLPGGLVLQQDVFNFKSLDDLQQRSRWTRQLAEDFVDRVLYRPLGTPNTPEWWVTVFDNCRDAPAEAQEFVRRLVEFAAGTGPDDVDRALQRQLRIVLIGDGQSMLPSPYFYAHVLEEDLSKVQIGLDELKIYYQSLGASLGLKLTNDQIAALAQGTLDRCQQLLGESSPPPAWIDCIVRAVLEQTAKLETQAVKKGAKV